MNTIIQKFGICTRRYWLFAVGGVVLCVGIYGAYRPLPNEVGMQGTVYRVSDDAVTFLSDETFVNEDGSRIIEQEIFDEVFRMIENAEHFILLDMFLWNSFQGAKPELHRLLSSELTEALRKKKEDFPKIEIVVISDPINTVYGGQQSPEFKSLSAAGIPVVLTDLHMLRDSNPLYSSFFRTFLQWPSYLHTFLLGREYTFRWLPNIMDAGGEKVTLRSYLQLFNFKANHRKLIVADAPKGEGVSIVTLVTSANPHDGSSAHSNVALRIEGEIWKDVLRSEQMVAKTGNVSIPLPEQLQRVEKSTGTVSVALRSEQAILEEVLAMLGRAGNGDTVELAMFYLSEKHIIDALVEASKRGANVRVILDPNKDAFGMEKNGVPNRPVAHALIRDSNGGIEIRWCATHGEQCHTKLLLVESEYGYELLLGSANYTRRNLHNLNLETNVWVSSKEPSTAYRDAKSYFARMWKNDVNRLHTLEYEAYASDSFLKRVQAWVMERTGLSTF